MEREVRTPDPRPTENGTTAPASSPMSANRSTLRRQTAPNLLVKIQDIFFMCLRSWKWFVLSLAICLTAAYYTVKRTPNLYQRSASLLIKGDDRNPASSQALKELGIDMTPSNVTNEIMALTTSDVAQQIVKRLDLDVEYYREGKFLNQIIYGEEVPVKVSFHNLKNDENIQFKLALQPDSTVMISNIVRNGQARNGKIKMRLGQTRKTSLGVITIVPTDSYTTGMTDEIIVKRLNPQQAASMVNSRLSASLRSTGTTLIDINYFDYSPTRAEDILRTLVDVYNENWINDQNRITFSTNKFIGERLGVLEGELGDVERNIADYKSEHLMLDPMASGQQAQSKATTAEETANELDNKIYMTEYVKNYITGGMHTNQLLPSNTGIGNPSIESQIQEYNRVLMQRNSHLAHSSEQNPLVMDLEESLAIMRASIIESLDNELTLLNTQRRSVETTHAEAVNKIAESPAQSTYIISVERQQKVKEQLYLFLLQKREENELSQAFAAYNSRLIEPPHGSWNPIEPQPQRTYMIAFIIGLLVPAGFIVIKEGFNTVIRGRKDLEQLSVPFVGEIPLDRVAAKRAAKNQKEKAKKHKKGKHHEEPAPELVVVEKSRNVMNEAFRVVRSNLEFILGFDNKHHVIMVTSMNPSSGKTFITANLASSLGINNKRVIAIDLDMRKGSLSKYVNRPPKGVANYLSGQLSDYRDVIINYESIDVLPCGTLPPNPAELLYSPRFKKMIEEVSQEYDYVFLDCPPVEVVADAAIINRYADITLFVIRAQLMDRAFLPDIEHWYEEKRYKNLSVILNGTTDAFSHYGYHKYGYRYGYHYGNYGYGYGNTDD